MKTEPDFPSATAASCKPQSAFHLHKLAKAAVVTLVGVHALACLAADNPPTNTSEPELPPRTFASVSRTNTVGLRPLNDRAFFGAPPPIRHVGIVASERTSDCLQCHAKKNRIALRQQAIAPVPHAEFTQCTQCHVQAKPDVKPFRTENTFVGLDLPGKGSRAHPYAPPTVPHKTFLRDNCIACHGPTGLWRIKTPHPFRTVCLQCHAIEATQQLSHPALPKPR